MARAIANKNIAESSNTSLARARNVATDTTNLAAVAGAYGRIFTRFNVSTDILPSVKEIVSATCWDDADGYLTSFYSSSTELAYSSSNYYWNVFQNSTEAGTSTDPHFAIAYGHNSGLGSVTGSAALYTGNLSASRTPSKAIYSQYKNILLLPDDSAFTFDSTSSNDIWVINFNRARYKEKLDPGNWELQLSGSTRVSKFIDDSGASGVTPSIGQSGRIFHIVSGSITGGTASSTVYGLVYPDVGILVFHPAKLSASIGLVANTASFVSPGINSNTGKMYTAISGGASFQARTEENISSTYYFVRVGHSDYNYTNNPTFVTGSLGLIRYSLFHTDPRVYITTVGLYNDTNELLAVAKLSQPLIKSFTRETLIRIKVDF